VYNRWTQAYRVDVTEREFELMVEQLRRRLEAGLRGVELTAHLSEILLKNVRLDWEDVRLLLIAPDGPLWRIPIEVLLIQVSPVERKALGALAPVALIPSVSTIRQMQRREESVTQRVFLGVLYDGSTPSLALAGAPVEIDMIRAHVGADTVHVIIGGNGGISGISANVAYYLPTATYVHIAAHAFADEHGGEAYILLSDYRGRQERLVSSQIESLELSAKLVVLATCHSSLGRSSAGEGMVSLARSFLLAGAQCVVASLWQLDDAKSVHFFSLLYEYVKEGGSLARAFKRAKDSYSDAFGYDATWAGLTILGNTESWEDRYSPLFVAEGR
jgi:CHAT domain-containing protein